MAGSWRLHDTDRNRIEELLQPRHPAYASIATDLRDGTSGFWIQGDAIEPEEMPLHIDAVQHRRLR